MTARPTLTVGLPNFGSFFPLGEWHRFVDLARVAEDAGVDRIVVVDHVVMGPQHRRVLVGQVPDAARRAVARTADGARGDGRGHRRGSGSRPASSSRRCGPPCCSRSRPRRSTCCRRAGSISASAPAGSARSTTPKGSTSRGAASCSTDTHRGVQGAVARHAGRARHADAVVPRHLLRPEAGAAGRRAAVDRRARCTSATSIDSCATATRGSRSWARPSTASRPAREQRGPRGEPPGAIPTGCRCRRRCASRVATTAGPTSRAAWSRCRELVAAGATDIHVYFAAFCRDPADAPRGARRSS